MSKESFVEHIAWTAEGLAPAIAQDYKTGEVLMMAWMNRDSLFLTVHEKRAVYWSRSRSKLWHKGEESGHIQIVHDIRLDCDQDVILLRVEQIGDIACHTGRRSCFYQSLKDKHWQIVDDVLKDPKKIYRDNHD
jgi:phosphoribosyl-AMP cyclohydrolase